MHVTVQNPQYLIAQPQSLPHAHAHVMGVGRFRCSVKGVMVTTNHKARYRPASLLAISPINTHTATCTKHVLTCIYMLWILQNCNVQSCTFCAHFLS